MQCMPCEQSAIYVCLCGTYIVYGCVSVNVETMFFVGVCGRVDVWLGTGYEMPENF